jgi:hypothetical protein
MPEVQRAIPLASAQGMAGRQGSPLARTRKGSDALMNVSIPLVALFAVGACLAWRFMGLRLWQMAMSMICGFLVADTSAAPQVNHALTALIQWIHL